MDTIASTSPFNDSNFLILFIVLLFVTFFAILAMVFSVLTYISAMAKKKKKKDHNNETYQMKLKIFAEAMSNALIKLSEEKIGALMVVENHDDLSTFQNNGYSLAAGFSPEFMISVFSNKKCAFHDGAVLISDFRIFAISSYLPMTKNTLDVKYGARHRAAVGMSEINDSYSFVVSETSGTISIAYKGKLRAMPNNHEKLKIEILRFLEQK